MSELTLHIAGHDIYMVQDEFGTWLIDGIPYTDWIEFHAPQEVIDEAARRGLEQSTSDPEVTEDAIQRLEMPDEMADQIRAFYPNEKDEENCPNCGHNLTSYRFHVKCYGCGWSKDTQ